MKKILFLLFALFITKTIDAQVIEIYKNGGTTPFATYINNDTTSYKVELLNNYDYVDLGLPSGTLWATINVGASKPEEYGDYFAWGETTPKSVYNWDNYKFGQLGNLTKYCSNETYGVVDNKFTLDAEDDAATANWSTEWRIPTLSEINELVSNTNNVWTTINGVKGQMVSSKTNNNSIFLPAAGEFVNNTTYELNSNGLYWCNERAGSDGALLLSLSEDGLGAYGGATYRSYGISIRPVRGARAPRLYLDKSKDTIEVDNTLTLTPTILNSSATVVTWTSSNTEIASVDNGVVMGIKEGYATIYCQLDGTTAKDSCVVLVESKYDYVDLGLPSGTLWATINIGANKPEEYGDYFAWGETEPYYTSQDPLTWKDGKSGGYCWESYCGTSYFTEWTTVPYEQDRLKSSNDAATVNWGSNWRMPTNAEFEELINSSNTTTEWTTMNGVYGRKITSNANGNSIFLPAAGYRYDTFHVGSYGSYWSSSLHSSYNVYAQGPNFTSSDINSYSINRFFGRSVRPVKNK